MQQAPRPTVSPDHRCSPHNIAPSGFVTSFVPQFYMCPRKKKPGLCPLGHELLCRSPGEVLGRETYSVKAGRHHTACGRVRDERCPQLRDVVLTTLVPRAPYCHFGVAFTFFSPGK